MHGTADDTIPCALGQRLHRACPGSELWLVEGAGHNNLRAVAGEEEYVRRLEGFARRITQPGGPADPGHSAR